MAYDVMNKWLKWAINIVPLLAAIFTTVLWVDTRYMHKDISDARFIDMQMAMYERYVKVHERRIDREGYKPSEEEKREYDLMVNALTEMEKARNKVLGLPQ